MTEQQKQIKSEQAIIDRVAQHTRSNEELHFDIFYAESFLKAVQKAGIISGRVMDMARK